MSRTAKREGVETEAERQAQATQKYHDRLRQEGRCRHCKIRPARVSWWTDKPQIFCGVCALIHSKQKEVGRRRMDDVALAWRVVGGIARAIKVLNTAASQAQRLAELCEAAAELKKRRKPKGKQGADWLR